MSKVWRLLVLRNWAKRTVLPPTFHRSSHTWTHQIFDIKLQLGTVLYRNLIVSNRQELAAHDIQNHWISPNLATPYKLQLYIACTESDYSCFNRMFSIWFVLALTIYFQRKLYAQITPRKNRSFWKRKQSKFSGKIFRVGRDAVFRKIWDTREVRIVVQKVLERDWSCDDIFLELKLKCIFDPAGMLKLKFQCTEILARHVIIYRTIYFRLIYRGVTHQSITFGFGLRHIRVSHLVLGLHTLDYHTWSRARTH